MQNAKSMAQISNGANAPFCIFHLVISNVQFSPQVRLFS